MSKPADPREYISLETLVENIIDAFKDEISNVDGIDDINEGEKGYDESMPTQAWVVSGQMRPDLSSTSSLRWRTTIYVILINSQEGATLPELRKVAYSVYDELAKDVTHGGTCWATFPRLFHPGYVAYSTEQLLAGVLMSYDVEFYQKYINDSS